MKRMIRNILPPIFLDVYKRLRYKEYIHYFGKYRTWDEAEKASRNLSGRGYDSSQILKRAAASTKAVREKRALFEQDGVLFYEPCNNYELLAAFLYAKVLFGKLDVIDWGGALGSTYFHYQDIFRSTGAKWRIVEQQHFVEYGKKHIPEIGFYETVRECLAERPSNVLFSSSTFMYLPNPFRAVREALSNDFDCVIIDKTEFFKDPKAEDAIMVQHIPPYVYGKRCSYPARVFGLDHFKAFLDDCGWKIEWEWDYQHGSVPVRHRAYFEDTADKGFLLIKK